jgi:hypothetical protein
LKWNYDKGYANLSMPKYVLKQLTRYAHPAPLKPQHCPFLPNPISYGKDNQAPTLTDEVPLSSTPVRNALNKSSAVFLYYARAVDPTLLMALSNIACQSAAPTE